MLRVSVTVPGGKKLYLNAFESRVWSCDDVVIYINTEHAGIFVLNDLDNGYLIWYVLNVELDIQPFVTFHQLTYIYTSTSSENDITINSPRVYIFIAVCNCMSSMSTNQSIWATNGGRMRRMPTYTRYVCCLNSMSKWSSLIYQSRQNKN